MSEIMDALMARVDRQLTMMRDLGDQMKAVRATATSGDGVVSVTVDGNGGMIDLRLSADIEQLSPDEFGHLLTDTAARAVGEAFRQRGDLVTAFNEAAAENNQAPPLSGSDNRS